MKLLHIAWLALSAFWVEGHDLECDMTGWNLELLFLQDATGSFRDFWGNIEEQLEQLAEDMKLIYPEPRFGVAAYQDKACQGGDKHCYHPGPALSNSVDELLTFFRSLEDDIGGGGPDEEGVPDALLRVALEDHGWTSGARDEEGRAVLKLVIVVADSEPQREGDAGEGTECDLPASSGDPSEDCEAVDYPSSSDVHDRLMEIGVWTLFLVKPRVSNEDYYIEYIEELGVPAHLELTSSDFSNLAAQALKGLDAISCLVEEPPPATTTAEPTTATLSTTTEDNTTTTESTETGATSGTTATTTEAAPSTTTTTTTTVGPPAGSNVWAVAGGLMILGVLLATAGILYVIYGGPTEEDEVDVNPMFAMKPSERETLVTMQLED